MADHHTIDYDGELYSSASGWLPYDFALKHAWLSMIRELHGEVADLSTFFRPVPEGMFVTNSGTVPHITDNTASGHLDEGNRLFFSVSQNKRYLPNPWGSTGAHHVMQTFLTLTLDSAGSLVDGCFSTVIFNSVCDLNSFEHDADRYGDTAMVQSGFHLRNQEAEQLFRSAAMPLKLAGHPLLKHYRI